ncbi:UNVERIFIED_CONTAM: Retrovirus-related Pol polyprotein from transposon TNT 1-94 [Sesamum indicum]
MRLFLAIAAAREWPLQQLDINNAFLHGHLEEYIYMTLPEGYEVESHLVCKFKRLLYGLKQASRKWNVEFTLRLTTNGFRQSAHEHRLFVKDTASGPMVLLVYIDDILIIGPLLAAIREVKDYLHTLFTNKDIGDARYFFGFGNRLMQ